MDFKDTIKITHALKSAFKADRNDGRIGVDQQIGCVIDPQAINVFRDGNTAIFFQISCHVLAAFSAQLDHALISQDEIFGVFHLRQ